MADALPVACRGPLAVRARVVSRRRGRRRMNRGGRRRHPGLTPGGTYRFGRGGLPRVVTTDARPVRRAARRTCAVGTRTGGRAAGECVEGRSSVMPKRPSMLTASRSLLDHPHLPVGPVSRLSERCTWAQPSNYSGSTIYLPRNKLRVNGWSSGRRSQASRPREWSSGRSVMRTHRTLPHDQAAVWSTRARP